MQTVAGTAAEMTELDVLGQKIERWRSEKPRTRAMPEELWEQASEAARSLEVGRVSKALKLGYATLQRRSSAEGVRGKSSRQDRPAPVVNREFVELSGFPPSDRWRVVMVPSWKWPPRRNTVDDPSEGADKHCGTGERIAVANVIAITRCSNAVARIYRRRSEWRTDCRAMSRATLTPSSDRVWRMRVANTPNWWKASPRRFASCWKHCARSTSSMHGRIKKASTHSGDCCCIRKKASR